MIDGSFTNLAYGSQNTWFQVIVQVFICTNMLISAQTYVGIPPLRYRPHVQLRGITILSKHSFVEHSTRIAKILLPLLCLSFSLLSEPGIQTSGHPLKGLIFVQDTIRWKTNQKQRQKMGWLELTLPAKKMVVRETANTGTKREKILIECLSHPFTEHNSQRFW